MLNERYLSQQVPAQRPTLLYGVKPEGIKTPAVESLYSWLVRIAFAHDMAPARLVREVIGARTDLGVALQPGKNDELFMQEHMGRSSGWSFGWGWDKHEGKTMLGTDQGAKQWVKVLTRATGNFDAELCTFRRLRGLVSTNRLVTNTERVCISCLRSDVDAGHMPYERLLWRLVAVKCCPVHEEPLVDAQCGKTDQTPDPYLRIKHPGVCSGCGSIGYRCRPTSPQKVHPGDLWRAEQCAHLIEGLHNHTSYTSDMMKQLVRGHAQDSDGLDRMSQRAGTTKSVLSRWLSEPSARLSLEQLLDLAASVGISLDRLLAGEWVPVETPTSCKTPRRPKREIPQVDHEALRAAMQEGIAKGMSPSGVASLAKVDLSTMRRHEDLYLPLRTASQARAEEETRARRASALDEAERVATHLMHSGLALSLRNAGELTGDRWYPSQLRAQAFQAIEGIMLHGQPPAKLRLGHRMMERAELAARRLSSRACANAPPAASAN